MSQSVDEIFSSFRDEIEADQQLRENIRTIVRELERVSRNIALILQKIHQPAGVDVKEICAKARKEFETVRTIYSQLAAAISPHEYFKYSDHYRYANHRLIYLAAFLVYLETGAMVSKETTAEMLGISLDQSASFHLDLEDYLLGLLQMASELSRLSVNFVTIGDYEQPFKISSFLNDLDSGFRLLNLKNDGLRKRYDALKYDVKKVEEVVYDLTIRGLRK